MRTNKQNRYYRGLVVVPVAKRMVCSPVEAHDFLKIMFLRNENGVMKSTAKISAPDFEKFLAQCRTWAWDELKLEVALPNEPLFDISEIPQ